MAVTLDEVRALKADLEPNYQERHSDFQQLRDFWHGRYWKVARANPNSISTIFRDLVSRPNVVGPEIMLVHNVLQEICVKFQTYLCGLPMISVFTDPPSSQTRRAQADKKERFLYGCWEEGDMSKVMADIAWYLPLFGQAYLAAFPDFDCKIPKPVLRSPENAYPVVGFDGKLGAVIFSWKVPDRVARRDFPKYKGGASGDMGSRGGFFGNRSEEEQGSVEILEYSDGNEWHRWVGDTEVNGVVHNFGFNLFGEMKFISVPGEAWGHGAVEQIANLVAAGNALDSLLFQAVYENVFPTLVLEDASKAPEEIEQGPGAVLPLNPGGKAYYLAPPVNALGTQAAFSGEVERKIKQGASMPDVNFGQFRASIVTGKAINELQGAGTGSTIEMVQSVGVGPCLVDWNSKAIEMTRTMFPDDQISMFGVRHGSTAEINPKRFALNLKGKELIGSTRNEVVFSPYLNQHEKIVMGLQMAGAGLVSKRWQRDQVGIPDSEAMDEEMVGEAIQDAVIGAIVQGLQAASDPATAMAAEEQAVAYMAGATNPGTSTGPPAGVPPVMAGPAGAPGPGGAPAMGGGGPPIGPIGPGGPGQVVSPPIALPPGAPPPAGAPAAMPTGSAPLPQTEGISLDEAVNKFSQLTGIKGRVFLVGAIVQDGVSGTIEVDVTEQADEQTIQDQLSDWQAQLAFHVVKAEPDEAHVEVTPGVAQKPQVPQPSAVPGEPPPDQGAPGAQS